MKLTAKQRKFMAEHGITEDRLADLTEQQRTEFLDGKVIKLTDDQARKSQIPMIEESLKRIRETLEKFYTPEALASTEEGWKMERAQGLSEQWFRNTPPELHYSFYLPSPRSGPDLDGARDIVDPLAKAYIVGLELMKGHDPSLYMAFINLKAEWQQQEEFAVKRGRLTNALISKKPRPPKDSSKKPEEPKTRIDPKKVEEMLAAGKTISTIARTLKVSRQAIHKHIKKKKPE